MKQIAISLSPNAQRDDVFLALKTLFSPWRWNNSKDTTKLENKFSKITKTVADKTRALAVNSGRSALYIVLKALQLNKESEVIVQAFTCIAVPNAVLWTGAKPVYVDIDDTYNIDPRDLEKKITSKTKAVVVQHTFGIPADLDRILEVIKKAENKYKKKIYLIEDCAHALGANFKGKPLGTFGEAAIFSFGRDKVISSVFGGMIVARDKNLYIKISKLVDKLEYPSHLWTIQQLFHPIAFSIILPLYSSGLGKIILVLLQKIGLLSKAIYKAEGECKQPTIFPTKMPGGLSLLAGNQIAKLDTFNLKRREIAKYYFKQFEGSLLTLPESSDEAIWLRFPVRTNKSKKLYDFAKKSRVLLGNWYKDVIVPAESLDLAKYKKGSCPKAEKYSKEIVNLPTYPNMTIKDAERVVSITKKWLNTK